MLEISPVAEVKPFPGVRYAGGADPNAVTSPPYDVISAEEHERLERASPHNVVRLILGRDERGDDATRNKYTRAASLLEEWLREGVLVRDATERLYVYEQTVRVSGETRRQIGVMGAITIDPTDVLPHERTMASPVEDRLALLRATAANLAPIVCITAEPVPQLSAMLGDHASSEPPLLSFAGDDGVGHRLWAVDDAADIEALTGALSGSALVIADGHHRYRTAETYRSESDRSGADALLALVLAVGASGPIVLPIHRIVRAVPADTIVARLSGSFRIQERRTTVRELEQLVAEMRRDAAAAVFGIHDGRRAWIAALTDPGAAARALPKERSATWRSLDVAVLHAFVFERLLAAEGPVTQFGHTAAEAEAALASGAVAVLLAPTPVEAVIRIAKEGESMPPKSTFFFPKPRSGLVIRPLE